MDEVKFKVWTGSEMLGPFDLSQNPKYWVGEMQDGKILLCTGLKDVDGNEIYEGDLIYWEIDNGVGVERYTAVVVWSEDLVEQGHERNYGWLVKYTDDCKRGSYDKLSTPATYNSELQVFGNIYENKLSGEL